MSDNEILPKPEESVPTPEKQQNEAYNEQDASKSVESGSSLSQQHLGGSGVLVANDYVQAQGALQQASAQPQNLSTLGSSRSLPMTADDIDLIEKEWVIKAKEIVAATIGDPKKQSTELSRAKADYISKRFGKELPQNE